MGHNEDVVLLHHTESLRQVYVVKSLSSSPSCNQHAFIETYNVRPSVRPSVRTRRLLRPLNVRPSVRTSTRPSARSFVCPSVLFVRPSVRLPAHPSTRPSVYPRIHPSISRPPRHDFDECFGVRFH